VNIANGGSQRETFWHSTSIPEAVESSFPSSMFRSLNMIPVRASPVSEARERVTQIDAQRGKMAEQKDPTARVTQGFDQADRPSFRPIRIMMPESD
jgi:hypothetical protein